MGVFQNFLFHFGSEDELEIEEAVIESNRQRDKTNEQTIREKEHLVRIISNRQSRQGANQYSPKEKIGNKNGASVVQTTEAKPPSQQAAEAVGLHRTTATKGSAVVKAIDKLEAEGKTVNAEQVRKTLNSNGGPFLAHRNLCVQLGIRSEFG